jgi:hypothetical protein
MARRPVQVRGGVLAGAIHSPARRHELTRVARLRVVRAYVYGRRRQVTKPGIPTQPAGCDPCHPAATKGVENEAPNLSILPDVRFDRFRRNLSVVRVSAVERFGSGYARCARIRALGAIEEVKQRGRIQDGLLETGWRAAGSIAAAAPCERTRSARQLCAQAGVWLPMRRQAESRRAVIASGPSTGP